MIKPARRKNTAILTAALLLLCPWNVSAIDLTELSGVAHGYPAVWDLNGKRAGDSEFFQSVEDGKLRIRITYKLTNGDRVEEKGVFRQEPELIQEEWQWRELKGGELSREFKIDFKTKLATAQKRDGSELKHWDKVIEVEEGRTFAGFGFTLALQNLRKRLVNKEVIELKAVGFTPKPQVVTVQLSHHGVEQMRMAGRLVKGDRFVIHPQIPAIAKLFISVPDTNIWLTNPTPAGFLRWEGPMGEPGDPVMRVDLMSGEESGVAKPAADESR